MTYDLFNKKFDQRSILQMALIVVMVFAAWHVASHDIDTASEVSVHEECQACRIGQIPIADLPVTHWVAPLLSLSLKLVVTAIQRPVNFYHYTPGARAPPLF